MKSHPPLVALFVLVACGGGPVRAETVQSCTGFIASLPATIATQGVWCMSQDLSTAIETGNAVEITTNNVTIDCNGFKIGGLAAGIGTQARGIFASNRLNLTVRNCLVRGFRLGIAMTGTGGGGHVVEDNRLDGNTQFGIAVSGDGSVVRRNRVNDTGATTEANFAVGILGDGQVDVLDNVVDVVLPGTSGADGTGTGINLGNGSGTLVARNSVRGVEAMGSSFASGIIAISGMGRTNLRDNHVVGNLAVNTYGIRCSIFGSASGNFIADHVENLDNSCSDDGGNVLK